MLSVFLIYSKADVVGNQNNVAKNQALMIFGEIRSECREEVLSKASDKMHNRLAKP